MSNSERESKMLKIRDAKCVRNVSRIVAEMQFVKSLNRIISQISCFNSNVVIK